MHFSFGYTLFIWVCNFFGYATFGGYALSIWVYIHILFGYALYIWVCTFYLGMHFSFGCALFIWVCTFHLGVHFLFGYALFDRQMRMRLYAPRGGATYARNSAHSRHWIAGSLLSIAWVRVLPDLTFSRGSHPIGDVPYLLTASETCRSRRVEKKSRVGSCSKTRATRDLE